jgi:Na+/melibiose symporter-like transporter
MVKRVTRGNLRLGLVDAFVSTPWTILALPNSFLMVALLTQFFSIGPGDYGIIASMPLWANALQILIIPLLGRLLNARDLSLSFASINVGLWLMLLMVLPLLAGQGTETVAHFFIGFFALVSISMSLSAVGWISWIQGWVHGSIRGSYFGKRNANAQVVSVIFFLLAMYLLAKDTSGVLPYFILVLIALLGRLAGVICQYAIQTPNTEPAQVSSSNWFATLWELRRDRNLMWMMAFGAWIGLWVNAQAPFTAVFVMEFLHVSQASFTGAVIASMVGSALTLRLWGHLSRKFGNVKIITVSVILWWFPSYSLPFLSPESSWIVFPIWFASGACSGGFILGAFNLLLALVKRENKTAAVSLNVAITSLISATGPLLYGSILQHFAADPAALEATHRRLLLLTVTAVLVSPVFLLKVRDSRPQTTEMTLLGGMRVFRQTMQATGINFLANSNFFGRRRKKGERPPSPRLWRAGRSPDE